MLSIGIIYNFWVLFPDRVWNLIHTLVTNQPQKSF